MTNQEIFKQNGYCIVKNAISNELRDFITQYALFDEMQDFDSEQNRNEYRNMSTEELLKYGYIQVPNAHSKYANPAMEVMLLNLQNIMQDNTGLELFPTYSYHRLSRNGNELSKHKDRPSCEISATLCFNYSYDDSKYQWPIYIEENKIDLFPGDLVIYRGCDLNHWRNQFDIDEDAWHLQGFFHYVDANGPHSSHKWDRRVSVGARKDPINTTENQISMPKYIQFTE